MPTKTLEKRVDDLQIAMTSLSTLPARVASLETQDLHLRDEMRAGFSAIRGELDGLHGEVATLRGEVGGLRGGLDGLRTELDGLRSEARAEAKSLRDELHAFRTGPGRMATWSETKAMYEDLVDRIKLLGEGILAAVTGAATERMVPVPVTTSRPVGARARRAPRKKR